jgi:hypothetical protein
MRILPNEARGNLPLVWSWRMMQINFLLIYAISLPYKFAQDLDWLTGDALHWTLASDMWWSRGWMSELTLGYNGAVRKMMTWGTVLVEGLFPVLVWFRCTKVPITLAVIGLHLGIAFCIPGVTLFTISMVAGAAMFLPIDFYLKLTQRLGAGIQPFWQPLFWIVHRPQSASSRFANRP